MRRNLYIIFSFISLALLAIVSGCEEDEKDATGPVITIDEGLEEVEAFNVGDKVTITVNVKSKIGVKRLAYYFITATDNGTLAGTPVFIDKADLPQEITEEIVFTVEPGLVEIVIISFDRDNNNSEIHISPENIRSIPVLSFKDGVKYRETVFENKTLRIEGSVTSEYELAAITFQTIVNGDISEDNAIPVTDPKSMPFTFDVVVTQGLEGLIIKAENIHEGIATDTFKIATVVADDVNIALEGGSAAIPIAYADVTNTLNGSVFSGSAVVSLTYALKANDVYGAEIDIPIGDPDDEFPFSIEFVADKNIQALRITGENAGNITKVAEYPVEKVYSKLVHFTDITLTSAIGPGLNNWFAAWQSPHVFDINNAAANQLMVDIALVKYSASSFRIMPAAVFDAGAAYKTAMAPYMVGFTKAPYTLVTVNRNAITPEAFDELEWDGQMIDFLDAKIKAPVASGGENYNFYGTNRRFNGDLQVGKAFIIGWGQWDPIENKAFGIVMVKAYSVVNGEATAILEIKVPSEDMRTKYNPVSIFDYEP